MPPYFDYLIDSFHRGEGGRFVHLGHWDEPTLEGPAGAGEFEAAQERLNDRLLEMADLRDGQAVLDVGCGFGGTLERVDERHREMRLVGINVDPRQLQICRELVPRGDNAIEWDLADACELPFSDGEFDRVLCIEAMFHFASRRRFFAEAARVLRPGGAMVASDIVLTPSAARLETPGFCIEAPLQDGYGPWPDLWDTDCDHGALAADCGLSCDRIVDATLETLPSHRFTVSTDLDEARDPGNASQRAAMMLKWLHHQGHLKYLYLRFSKP